MNGFDGTISKASIRKQWDLPIIQQHAEKLERPLSYFGLPGPQIEDLLCWQSFLGIRTGIERLRKSAELQVANLDIHRQLMRNAMVAGISDGFELRRGYIEDLILTGVDIDGKRPRLSFGEPALSAVFCYDVVNLDFFGGMGYRDSAGESKRVKAMKKLIERQKGTQFLLLLTLNVRDNIRKELTDFLTDFARQSDNPILQKILKWYGEGEKGRKDFLLKAAVPLFIRETAEFHGFDCRCYSPLVYSGTGSARMVHFVFELIPSKSMFRAISSQSQEEILNLPFIEVEGLNLRVMALQHPGFDPAQCDSALSFLPKDASANILRDLPRSAETRRAAS